VDTHRHALTRDGGPIDLSPRDVEILAHLLSHPDKVIATNELLDTVWADVFVTENNLEQAIGAIRKAVDDDAAAQRLIQTVKRKGYRFVGAVDASGAPPQRDAFDDWMKGRLSLESLNAGQLHDATAAFERVRAQDDTYAPAHTALANAYFLQYEVTRPENTPNRSLLERATPSRVSAWRCAGRRTATGSLFFESLWPVRDLEDPCRRERLQQLTEDGSSYPTWSPDGSRMAVGVIAPQPKAYVFETNRPWKNQSPDILPASPSTDGVFMPNSWSRDSERLAGQIGQATQGIATYSFRTRSFDVLTDFGEHPVWLPDSRRILFVTGGTDFFVIDAVTKRSRKVYTGTREVVGPPRLTGDGRTAYFTRRITASNIWLLKIE
jgi:DNA-binding winged helix-turn-helix (wHTH) protein